MNPKVKLHAKPIKMLPQISLFKGTRRERL